MNLFCKHKNKNNSGFTIIEIVIVIVIIGIIAGIVLVVYPNYKRNAIENALKSDLINAKSGLASSMNFNNHFPTTADCNLDNPEDGCPIDTDDTTYYYLTPEGYTEPNSYELYATRDGIVYLITNNSDPLKITKAIFIDYSTNNTTTCANSVNGKVYCWGYNNILVPTEVIGMNNVKKIALGNDLCVINNLKKIYCGGINNKIKAINTNNIIGSKNFISISSGGQYYCAITSDKKLYCWGSNSFGQLGNGTTTASTDPVLVESINNVNLVATDSSNTCAIASDNNLYCWGNNLMGQLGIGIYDNNIHSTPEFVGNYETFINKDIKYLSLRSNSVCIIDNFNKSYCWGDNFQGKIALSGVSYTNNPSPIDGSNQFSTISVGVAHGCSITIDNIAYCWGADYLGQLGDGLYGYETTEPQKILITNLSSDEYFISILASYQHTCAISSLHKIYCWGRNNFGQIGNGTKTERVLIPTPVTVPNI